MSKLAIFILLERMIKFYISAFKDLTSFLMLAEVGTGKFSTKRGQEIKFKIREITCEIF